MEKDFIDRNKKMLVKMIYQKTYLCPPDCGGEEFDEYGYVPHCPSCGIELKELSRDRFCRQCGQRLKWPG